MATKRNLKAKTPGEPDSDEVDKSVESNEQADESTDEIEFDESSDDDEITMSKRELAEMVSSMVEAQVEKRVVDEVKAARRRVELTKTQGTSEVVELPEQGEIDASKLRRSVLSKQGWVCPVVHPSDRLRMNNGNSL